jgi:cytochrome P450
VWDVFVTGREGRATADGDVLDPRRSAITENPHPDWDPRAQAVLDDQLAEYDGMRARCPVARSDYLGWSLFRHDDVCQVLADHETFSNAVSARLTVPNGMDPPEHTEYRRINDPYFAPALMDAFEPPCREIAVGLIQALPRGAGTELVGDLAQVFALRVQSAFLGWPADLEEPLRQWTRRNHAATLSRDPEAIAEVAIEFDGYIRDLLAVRREAGPAAPDDLTTRLLRERVLDRLMTDDELVSLLRNWTVGELSTIAASVGILARYLAVHPDIQQQLREEPALIPAANDEILRIHAPLISNRRVTTRGVDIRGRHVASGDRITVIWASANRDEAVFGDPDEFRLDRDPSLNLLYGAGIHVCPGAPLARLELRVLMEELLARTESIALAPGSAPTRAACPAGGFSSLPLVVS